MNLDVIRDILDVCPIAQPYEGCTPEEISALEGLVGAPLPPSYRAFLALMGRRAGYGLDSWTWSYDLVMQLAQERLDGNELELNGRLIELPSDAFFVFMYEGYIWAYLRTSLGDASPVAQMLEGEREPFEVVAPTFLDWLRDKLVRDVVTTELRYEDTVERMGPVAPRIGTASSPIVTPEDLADMPLGRAVVERAALDGAPMSAGMRAALGSGLHPLAALLLTRRVYRAAPDRARDVLLDVLAELPSSERPADEAVDLALRTWKEVQE